MNCINIALFYVIDYNELWKRGNKMIKRYKKNEIEDLVKILKNEGVISVPTDTVFHSMFVLFSAFFCYQFTVVSETSLSIFSCDNTASNFRVNVQCIEHHFSIFPRFIGFKAST